MEKSEKKRAVVSYENMNEELAAAFAEKYPRGFSDYFPDLVKYDKPDGSFFYAVTVETESAIYLVKIQVKTDDAEDIERWLDEEDGEDNGGSDEGNDNEDLPDNDIAQYSSEGEEEQVE